MHNKWKASNRKPRVNKKRSNKTTDTFFIYFHLSSSVSKVNNIKCSQRVWRAFDNVYLVNQITQLKSIKNAIGKFFCEYFSVNCNKEFEKEILVD